MAKPLNSIPDSRNDHVSRRMRSSVRHACRNAVLQAWIDETDQELREVLREGRARVASSCDDRRYYESQQQNRK